MERSETLYSDPAIIEAAARALECLPGDDELHRNLAMRVLAAVTPRIRAAALEEAADIADGEDCPHCAAAIRSLKEFAPEGRRWHHMSSGMSVTEIGRGRMQTDEPIGDMTPIVIYHHAGTNGGGTYWARPAREFEDGRFVAFIAEP